MINNECLGTPHQPRKSRSRTTPHREKAHNDDSPITDKKKTLSQLLVTYINWLELDEVYRIQYKSLDPLLSDVRGSLHETHLQQRKESIDLWGITRPRCFLAHATRAQSHPRMWVNDHSTISLRSMSTPPMTPRGATKSTHQRP